jgi:hypothetical protein
MSDCDCIRRKNKFNVLNYLNFAVFAVISVYLLRYKTFKNSRYPERYADDFSKTFYHQHLSTHHPQKSFNSGLNNVLNQN